MDDLDERIDALWADYSARIDEAKRRDGKESHALFLRWQEERIGDFPAALLTMERWILLHEADALLTGKPPSVETVLRFLWIVSPNFPPKPRRARWFFWRHRKIDLPIVLGEIFKYLERQLGGMSGGGESKGGSKEWISGIIDLVASEYGWKLSDILTMPLQSVFLLMRRIRCRVGGDPVAFNAEGDRLQAEFIEKANAMRRAN